MKKHLNGSESKIIKHHNCKKYITMIAFLCLAACIAVIVILMMLKKPKSSEQFGPTLPGADKINPAVMYNGTTYYWKHMTGPELPQGQLPQGYKYVGDIKYVDTGKLTKDFQLIATFNATGQLYCNADEPNNVCICITTYWLDDAYVIFSIQ